MVKVNEGVFEHQSELIKAVKMREKSLHPAFPIDARNAFHFFISEHVFPKGKENSVTWKELMKNGGDKKYQEKARIDKERFYKELNEHTIKIGLVLSGYRVSAQGKLINHLDNVILPGNDDPKNCRSIFILVEN